MNKLLITLHRWLGFPLGILFVVTFGTGCLTAVEELLERLEHANFTKPLQYEPVTSAEIAFAITTITNGRRDMDIGSITVPTESTPYYRVASRGEHWTYPIDDLSQVTYEQTDNDGFFRTVLQLHRDFLLGKEGLLGIEGKYYAVWVGLIALFLSLLGVYIWWPLRKSFKLKDVVPRGNKRKHYYYSHMTNGVITLIAVVLLALTGASITYRPIAQQILGIDSNAPLPIQPQALDNNWQSWIDAAYRQMPEGAQLTQIRYPRKPRGKPAWGQARDESRVKATEQGKQNPSGGRQDQEQNNNALQTVSFRFVTPGDWFGLARSSVTIDKRSSTMLEVSRFEDLPFNEKFYAILVPLHTGHDLPLFYVVLLVVLGLMGTIMVFAGLVSFMGKQHKWSKRSFQTSIAMATDQ